MVQEKIIVLDFGGQYNQLIARRVRDEGVYAEVYDASIGIARLREMKPKGIIFTGGPQSVYKEDGIRIDPAVFGLGIPILGLCYGAQLIAFLLGGKVEAAPVREYGRMDVQLLPGSPLFEGIPSPSCVWMSHTDLISSIPEGFRVTASSPSCPVAAMEDNARQLYALQFHPEVQHTLEGKKMLHNFLYNVCHCRGDWQMDSFIEDQIHRIREQVGEQPVLMALSGGVDSSVAATLLSRAVGRQLTCVFVDHGLLRKREGDEVEAIFGEKGQYELNFRRVDAKAEYLEALSGVTDPEKKRKIIGEMFIRVFEREARKMDKLGFLCQGTIYPDVVESGLGKGAVIKSHHNVGGLPSDIAFQGILEPLRLLFKDEVRQVGLELGLPAPLVYRQPFPGPGLAVRIMGGITEEKIRIVQDADAIFREELEAAGLGREISQYFAALSNMRTVGVMGDFRTYDYAVLLRAVKTDDFMTAEACDIPYALLQKVMNRIVNEVRGVNRVFYDLSSKPPGTIEME